MQSGNFPNHLGIQDLLVMANGNFDKNTILTVATIVGLDFVMKTTGHSILIACMSMTPIVIIVTGRELHNTELRGRREVALRIWKAYRFLVGNRGI